MSLVNREEFVNGEPLYIARKNANEVAVQNKLAGNIGEHNIRSVNVERFDGELANEKGFTASGNIAVNGLVDGVDLSSLGSVVQALASSKLYDVKVTVLNIRLTGHTAIAIVPPPSETDEPPWTIKDSAPFISYNPDGSFYSSGAASKRLKIATHPTDENKYILFGYNETTSALVVLPGYINLFILWWRPRRRS